MENIAENKLSLGNGATPFTVADAVIRECPDKDWLEDVVFYLNAYIERAYTSNVQADKREKSCNTCKNNNDDELSGECYECLKGIFDHYEAESEAKPNE